MTTTAHTPAGDPADVDEMDEVTRYQVAGITPARMREHLARYTLAPIPAEATTLVALHVARFDGRHPMVGETTTVPGLVIVPEVAGQPARFSGLWCLTHLASGMRVALPAPYVYIRDAAAWLATAGIDWTRPTGEVGTDPAAALVSWELTRATDLARAESRPLAYAHTSWVDWPPLWRVCHRGRVSEPGFFTYGGAADFADTACTPATAGGVAAELLHPDAVIHRDVSSPGWALRCAAYGCKDTDTWLIDDYDDGGGPIPWIGTRAELAPAARAEGWAEHDRAHWTCPRCTSQYR